MMKKFSALILILLFSFCTSSKKIDIEAPRAEYESKIFEADNLFQKGSYSSLKEAFTLYQDLLSLSVDPTKIREKLIKTALLIALREKELGIFKETYLKKASDLINEAPSNPEFSRYLEIVRAIHVESKGVAQDYDENFTNKLEFIRKLLESKDRMEQFKADAEAQEFLAYLYLTLNCSYYYISTNIKEDFSHFYETYLDSPSIKFKFALCAKEREELFEEIVEQDPQFYEAHYFMGEAALKKGHLVQAEKNLLKSFQEIPESPGIVITLANVYLAFEELEKSLEFYEKALDLVPEYRDALLRKAICLSYLGRNEEAKEVCNRLISLGNWYMGESHYWLAWNQHELGHQEDARRNVERSKFFLPPSSHVHALSGIISFEQNKLKEAEEDFKETLRFGRLNCEANFYLGKIFTQRQDWKNSGLFFEKAAYCNEDTEKAIREKLNEIRMSSLSEERKTKLLLKKEHQLKKTVLTKATAFYNAAAGYFNSGFGEKAMFCAKKAALHSAFKQKAEELVLRIKK